MLGKENQMIPNIVSPHAKHCQERGDMWPIHKAAVEYFDANVNTLTPEECFMLGGLYYAASVDAAEWIYNNYRASSSV
jgi:hypothetical protein